MMTHLTSWETHFFIVVKSDYPISLQLEYFDSHDRNGFLNKLERGYYQLR